MYYVSLLKPVRHRRNPSRRDVLERERRLSLKRRPHMCGHPREEGRAPGRLYFTRACTRQRGSPAAAAALIRAGMQWGVHVVAARSRASLTY